MVCTDIFCWFLWVKGQHKQPSDVRSRICVIYICFLSTGSPGNTVHRCPLFTVSHWQTQDDIQSIKNLQIDFKWCFTVQILSWTPWCCRMSRSCTKCLQNLSQWRCDAIEHTGMVNGPATSRNRGDEASFASARKWGPPSTAPQSSQTAPSAPPACQHTQLPHRHVAPPIRCIHAKWTYIESQRRCGWCTYTWYTYCVPFL